MDNINNGNETLDMKESNTPLPSSTSPDVPTLDRYYEKWNKFNDEDGVVCR